MTENGTKETKPVLVEIAPELWDETKIAAIRQGIPLKEFVARALKNEIQRIESQQQSVN